MHEIEQVRAWALTYAVSFLASPGLVVPGVVRVSVLLLIGLCWVRFVVACLTTRPVRKLPRNLLGVALGTGPVGALLLRRRVTTMRPVMTLRVKPRP